MTNEEVAQVLQEEGYHKKSKPSPGNPKIDREVKKYAGEMGRKLSSRRLMNCDLKTQKKLFRVMWPRVGEVLFAMTVNIQKSIGGSKGRSRDIKYPKNPTTTPSTRG